MYSKIKKIPSMWKQKGNFATELWLDMTVAFIVEKGQKWNSKIMVLVFKS